MCEHCRSGKMWKEDKEEDVCEWSNPEPLEDEDELPPMCSPPASGGRIPSGAGGVGDSVPVGMLRLNTPVVKD